MRAIRDKSIKNFSPISINILPTDCPAPFPLAVIVTDWTIFTKIVWLRTNTINAPKRANESSVKPPPKIKTGMILKDDKR